MKGRQSSSSSSSSSSCSSSASTVITSSTTTPASSDNRRRMQQQQQYSSLSERDQRSILRQTPPSAAGASSSSSYHYRTPGQSHSSSHHDGGRVGRSSFHSRNQQHHNQQQQQQLYRHQFDSPFTSPPPPIQKNRHHHQNPRINMHNHRPAPLILDPERSSPATPSASSTISYSERTPLSNSGSKVVHRLFEVAKRGMRNENNNNSAINDNNNNNNTKKFQPTATATSTPILNDSLEYTESAILLARSACSNAGYLQKLGTNIPEFKRRFFVLKPESNLYYYLSPNDVEPRGKIDLEGSSIEEIESLPDGRYRFAVTWDKPQRRQIVLEARSKEIGAEWMDYMKVERVSTLREKVNDLSSETESQKANIQDLEKQIADYKMIEKDRDGAIEDAKQWKEQFQRLDEALRLLTQRVRKPPISPSSSQSPQSPLPRDRTSTKIDNIQEEKKEANPLDDHSTTNEGGGDTTVGDVDPALLDELMDTQHNVEEIMDVPGTYFSALSNACQQQRESLRLAAIEASTAVEDVHTANQEVEASKKRMEKAEKHLTKLWEENCTMRKALKQKKREKRVLVREVKALQELTREMQEDFISQQDNAKLRRGGSENNNEGLVMEDILIGSDEDKLINELEQHVASSILLHEKLLAGTDFGDDGADTDLNTSIEESEMHTTKSHFRHISSHHDGRTTTTTAATEMRSDNVNSVSDSNEGDSKSNSPLRPTALQTKLHSLFDDVEEESEDTSHSDDDSDGEACYVNEYESIAPSISSVGAEMGDPIDGRDFFASDVLTPSYHSDSTSPERLNPMLELDDDHSVRSEHLDEKQPRVSATLKYNVTENGQATSRLVCPLADVVETPKNIDNDNHEEPREDLQVYHVTFYSQKIGLQFQKAPPAPSKPKGLLTDVIAADLAGVPNGSQTTAGELQSIANISSLVTKGRNSPGDDFCPVALPLDIVLVCGFEGFDDSGMNQKPDLGARLVAFNGVSVEVGRWTFDAIRKAIKSCGRPLTLSFRNAFLTGEQRAVLTRAVMEVEAKRPAPRPVLQYERPPSTTPSINSALSHETDHFVNDDDHETEYSAKDDDYSTTSSSTGWKRPTPGGNSSQHSDGGRRHSTRSSHSVSTKRSDQRSFSEAGTSSVLSNTIAPLVANLMKGVTERKEQKFTPVYLQERGETLKNTPQHLDFQSNLL